MRPAAPAARRRSGADQPNPHLRDLYLPINAQQKQLFDSIDGECTIGEIAREQADRVTAHAFFERLWWYDQVVFDRSRSIQTWRGAGTHSGDGQGHDSSCSQNGPARR
jgi:hypothetical protein